MLLKILGHGIPATSFLILQISIKQAQICLGGLEIVTSEFKVSLEKIEIINAYPQFQAWAESGGTENQDWYNNPDDSKVFVPEGE